MTETFSTRQKVAMCAALGAGAILGASGLVVYQRLRDNVGLKVTGSDFSQEIASLTTHIERLRLDIESLKGVNLASRLGELGSERDLLFTGKILFNRSDGGEQEASQVGVEEELQVRGRGGGGQPAGPPGDHHQLQAQEEPELGLRANLRLRLQLRH